MKTLAEYQEATGKAILKLLQIVGRIIKHY
jgi:hypothetical protein